MSDSSFLSSIIVGHFYKIVKREYRGAALTFEQSPQEWASWWASYDVAVHRNPTMATLDKLNFLKLYVHAPASSSIEGYALTEANYSRAVAALTQRYGRDDVREALYYSALHDLPDVSQRSSVAVLVKT